jgi:hypothetical protein
MAAKSRMRKMGRRCSAGGLADTASTCAEVSPG